MLNSSLRVATIAAALLAGSAFAQEITVTHAQGETVLPGVPENIIVFDLAAIDVLDALGIEIDGVPDATFPDYLSQYADLPKFGSLFDPDYEAIAAAAPDLIIVAGRSSTAYPQLSEIAPTIDVSNDWLDFRGTIENNTRLLAGIFGLEDEAESLIANLETEVAETRAAAADAGTGLIVMTSGGAVTAFGPGSRFGWIHEVAGVTPVLDDVEAATHGDAISFEFLLETNPDWLFVIDRDSGVTGENLAAATLDNELMAQTTAWQNDQVVYVEPVRAYIVNGGIQAITYMVDQIGDAFAE